MRNRVRTDEKDEYVRVVDGVFNLLVVASTGREIVAVKEDFVAPASQRKGN